MKPPPLPKHRKTLGELAETKFVSEAFLRGFRVCKPYGDSSPFDFIIEKGGRMLRIQVKSTARPQGRVAGHYQIQAAGHFNPRNGTRHYRSSEVDFLVGYVFPLETWYIVPIAAVRATAIYVRPGRGRGRFEQYREAWRLLDHPAPAKRRPRRNGGSRNAA